MDHNSPPSTPQRDTKPPTTSLPIARFPTTTSTATGSSAKRAAGSATTAPIVPVSAGGVVKKTTSLAASPAGRRRSGTSSSSGWQGIRPVERQLMRPWLIQKIDEGLVEGLEWVDAAHTRFRIPWKHGSRQGWKTEQDACLFMHWAQHTGRYRGSEAPNAKRWKANFRCALNSLPDAREVKTQSQTKGQNAYRVYEFLNERKAKVQHARTSSKSKCLMDGVKTEMGLLPASPTDTTQDIKYPLTPNSCTSGSASGHQTTTANNEEPVDQVYSQSPAPSPAASFTSSSTCSDDPYSPCSPPPAHQHTPTNISKHWMLHMENDSYRAIFPAATSSPASLPVPSTTKSTWTPQAATLNTNATFRRDVTATSSPSHAFPASPDHVMTSSTSFPTTTPVTSQSSMFNNGRSSAQMPYLTMDIGLSSHVDYDSGLGSPSSSGLGSPTSGFGSPSSGLGSPSSSHSDMDYAFSDDGSDVSVEISRSHIQELKRECLKTSNNEATFQQYQRHYQQQCQQRLQQQQQPTLHHSPTSTHNNNNSNNNYNNLYQMSTAQNRHYLQHNTTLNHQQQHNNQFNLQSNQLAGDYGFVEALQNAFGTNIPEEMASLDAEEVESVLSAEPYLNIDYKITVKTGPSIASTIEANLNANVHDFNCQT